VLSNGSKNKGYFMSAVLPMSLSKNSSKIRQIHEDGLFSPKNKSNSSKNKTSKTDLKSKKLLENKSVDFCKSKKRKSNKKITNLKEENDNIDENDDVKFNENVALLESVPLKNTRHLLKFRSLSKDVIKTTTEGSLVSTNDGTIIFESIRQKNNETKVKDFKAVILLNSIFAERPKVIFFQ